MCCFFCGGALFVLCFVKQMEGGGYGYEFPQRPGYFQKSTAIMNATARKKRIDDMT